jgi:hypothetical protein
LSPLLFIIAIDPLHRLFHGATSLGHLLPFPVREACFRASLYADDAVVFINPITGEIVFLLYLLHSFGSASELQNNIDKCSIAPIRCEDIDLDTMLLPVGGENTTFLTRYLGMPLSLSHLRLVELQFIIDMARGHLATWRGKWVNDGGRKALTASVLNKLSIFAAKSSLGSFFRIDCGVPTGCCREGGQRTTCGLFASVPWKSRSICSSNSRTPCPSGPRS